MASPKIVLITGTSTGVGFTTALMFAGVPDKRFKVFATMRNMEKRKAELEEAAAELLNTTLFIRELDVGGEASRVKCVEEILAEEKRIDILTWPFGDLYGHSKRALEAATESVAITMRPFNVWVSSIQLGAVMTQRNRQRVEGSNMGVNPLPAPDYITDETLKKMYDKQMKLMIDLCRETSQPAEEVAKMIMETAETDKPFVCYQSSEFARSLAEKVYVDTTGEGRLKLYEEGIWEMKKNI